MNKTEKAIVKRALAILDREIKRKPFSLTSPESVKDFLRLNLETQEREFFAVIFLDTRHKVISHQIMFNGTVDSAAVYPREVVKAALFENASAVILAHNHPSGDSSPSSADKRITRTLKDALALVDIRTLDHFVIGQGEIYSFAENHLI